MKQLQGKSIYAFLSRNAIAKISEDPQYAELRGIPAAMDLYRPVLHRYLLLQVYADLCCMETCVCGST